MWHLESEGCVSGMREAGEADERFRRDEFSFTPELHAADNCRKVHVAAALTRSENSALNLSGASEDCRSAIGHSETAIGVTVKSEFDTGVSAGQAADRLGDLFRAGAAGGVADDDAADVLRDTLAGELLEVIEAALVEIGIAGSAIFAAPATGIHGVLEVDEDFEAVLLEAVDGLEGHAQILFGCGFERLGNIEKA